MSRAALRYAALFGLTALLALRAAIRSPLWPLAVLLGWLAVALAGMALAYVLDSPVPLRKRSDGRISPLGYFLFWPVIGLNRLILLVRRLVIREPLMDEILPGLFLGGRPDWFDGERLRRRRIQSVLDMTAEFSETPAARRLRYAAFRLLDTRPGRLADLIRAVEWIDRARADGPILVHCALGHGRSAMIVAAYLIHAGQAPDAESALAFVRERRPGIELRSDQVAMLGAFAEQNFSGEHDERDARQQGL